MAGLIDKMSACDEHEPSYCGLRMTADEFLLIPDDGYNYELIDGVVQKSPSPEPSHQSVAGEIFRQLANFLIDHPVGRVWQELDVHLGRGPDGGDLVYRPEVVFVRTERLKGMYRKLLGAPDLVVEVISHGSRRMDTKTKRQDYERFGVKEYWIIDPEREEVLFLRLDQGRFVETPASGDQFVSQAAAGLALDLKLVREQFKPW